MASSVEHFYNLLKSLQDAYNAIESSSDYSLLSKWIDFASIQIENLSILIEAPSVSKHARRKYLALLRHFQSLKRKFQICVKKGGEIRREQENSESRVKWDFMRSAFENCITSGIVTNLSHLDVISFMDDACMIIKEQIEKSLNLHNAIKVNAELAAEYSTVKNDTEKIEIKYFNTKSHVVYSTTNLDEWFLENIRKPIECSMEEFQERDSGWALKSILNLFVNISKLNPLRGSSYIDLPLYIKNKKACVNVKNLDDQCFKWAVLSALHPHVNGCRVMTYKQYETELNFNGIDFPVSPKHISKFEKQNNISINVYILHKKGRIYNVAPCHVTSLKRETHINLLLIQDYYTDENDDDYANEFDTVESIPRFHYVWIKNLSRLVSKQKSAHNGKCFICDRCLHYFRTEDLLKTHEVDCVNINKCKVRLPEGDSKILKFKNFKNKERVPFVIYADFECLLELVNDNTNAFQRHKAYSVGYYVKCSYNNELSVYKSYRLEEAGKGQTPAEWFVKSLQDIAQQLEAMYESPTAMNRLTFEERILYEKAVECHICKKFIATPDDKVRDHCHFSGRYRGPAHRQCNILYRDSRTIPVIFHNLSGYDSHLFIKEIAMSFPGRISLLPITKEKYISFTKYMENSDINFRFIDSLRFMASSLDKLASYLDVLSITESKFKKDGYNDNQIACLKRKGVFPYEYVSSFSKLDDKELPAKELFYSTLNDSNITDSDYEHAKNVWQTLQIRTLGEYSDVYLKTDVLLLADVFENFRNNCLEAYELDPAHYYTSPGFSWDAMLKHTGVELELLTDIDMLLFIERGIRGGISQCCNRYSKANNEFMNDYRPEEEQKYLMYYDVNNLYGWAMTQYLPYGGFEWVDISSQSPLFFDVLDDNAHGYILEVDLEYPKEIHDSHKDLPLCPEHLAAPDSKQKKLMTTLYDKTRYVIHYRALKQAISYGLKLKKIHRALKFNQSAWLKKYIDLNSEKRRNARNEFEKMLFKLFNNAVYGKTMENERKRVDVKLVSKWNGRYGAEALIAKPNYHNSSIFDENLVAIELTKTEIYISKPIYVGLSVLDLSKTLVYRFHYDYMKKQVNDKCKLLYTDTDSLVYEIQQFNIYDLMKKDEKEFDTSDYTENNQFNIERKNKKIVGLMKDECNGRIMTEFIGLRSKMYSMKIQDANCIKKAKGVKGIVVKKTITFEDYVHCLRENAIITREQCNIRSRLHTIQTERQTKVALSSRDDKRYLLAGTTDTLPWGHYRIPGQESTSLTAVVLEKMEAAGEETLAPSTSRKVDACADIREGDHEVGVTSSLSERAYKEDRNENVHTHPFDEPLSKKRKGSAVEEID